MTETNKFSKVQRLNSTVMAKCQWTSSRMNMQKSGEEIHDRRTKTHRKANQFLEELLRKRTDHTALDDNGILDRYHHFLKCRSNLNDDDLLDEFDRRLRALNIHRRKQSLQLLLSNHSQSQTIGLQTDSETDRSESLSIISALNKTNGSARSTASLEDDLTCLTLNTEEFRSTSSEQSQTSITTNNLHRPRARRADENAIERMALESPLRRASSDVLIFHYCHFPRSLTIRTQTKSKSPSSPSPSPIVQYDNNQLFRLLDQIDIPGFTTVLESLTLSSVQTDPHDDPVSLTNDDEEEESSASFPPNLFEQSSDDYYTTFTIDADDPKDILVYTMTISTVQLSRSLLVPYSILTGRRPFLQSSVQTSFKRVHSKRQKCTCQVTAIEHSIRSDNHLQENDIIVQINNQSVWHLTTDDIRDVLEKHSKLSKKCLLTIARLRQPLI